MAFFSFRKPHHTTDPAPVAASPVPVVADPAVMRFLTLGGAVVTVTFSDSRYYARCRGCNWRNYGRSSETSTRDDANTHAGECRAMPRPEVP